VFIDRKSPGVVMKRIIVILVVVAVGGYFAYDYLQGKAKEKAAQEASQKERESRRAAVAQLVAKYNAVNDWEEKLLKGSASGGQENIDDRIGKLMVEQ
jgi:predicted negative regulator of RcsB-dependent stress response